MTTFLSRAYLTSDGSQATMTIPFPFISRNHVALTVNGLPFTAFTWTSDVLITFTPGLVPLAATVIAAKRSSVPAATLAQIQSGTILAGDLNLDDRQLIYLVQELMDENISTLHFPDTAAGLDGTLTGNFAGKLMAFDTNGLPIPSNKTLAQIEAGTGGAVSPFNTAATQAALKAIPTATAATYNVIYMTGFYSDNDGGQGWWVWEASNSSTDTVGTIVNPTGNAGNGRWVRQYEGALRDLWFGVKADNSTDNSTILQALETLAFSLGKPIYYPAQALARKFTTTLTTYPGVIHYGDGMNVGPYFGLSTGAGPSNLLYSGTAIGWTMQTAIGNVPVQGPCWRDMNITLTSGTSGIAINLNNSADTFLDDVTSQGAIEGVQIDRVMFFLSGRGGSTANAWNKVFNSRISGCIKFGGDYGILLSNGCDNLDIVQNLCGGGTIHEIKTVTRNTFQNVTWIRNNIFGGLSTGATGTLNLSARIPYVTDNWFENGSANSYFISLNNPITGIIRGNGLYDNNSTNWLVFTGVTMNLEIANNSGANITAANFNAGAGIRAWYTTAVPTVITGGGNGADGGIPFFTESLVRAYETDAPPISGRTIWKFTPSRNSLTSAFPYYSSVMVISGAFYVMPPAAAGANKLNWAPQASNRSITLAVDVWVLAYATVVTQVLTNVTTGDTITINSLTPAWFKITNNYSAVALGSLTFDNADTTHAGTIYIAQILLVGH